MINNDIFHRVRLGAARVGVAVACAAFMVACGGGSGGTPVPVAPAPEFPGLPPVVPETPTPEVPATVRLSVLSSPADRVMGTDALIEIEFLEIRPGARLEVTSNGEDMSALFGYDDRSGRLVGNVGNIRPGANAVEVRYGGYTSRLALTAFPASGPVFSGPHQAPFICEYNSFTRLGGGVFTPENDGNCGVKKLVSYFWVSTSGARSGYTPGSAYAGNMQYLTINGKTVPYLLRMESGTANRAAYQSVMLHDYLNEPVPAPTVRSGAWNGKLVYTMAGGCRGGSWYRQGNDFETLFVNDYIHKGYAVVSSTLNVSNQSCNDLLAAETVAAVKERFVKSYGVPVYTLGITMGSLGNAFQAHEIADNYPGLFDGIIVSQALPDMTSSALLKLHDSRLLNLYFTNSVIAPTTTVAFTDAQKLAISGFKQVGNIVKMSEEAIRMDPVGEFPAMLPLSARYHAVDNPAGARATVYDAQVNVYGRTAQGFAQRPMDNVGVQYGLAALNAGTITVEQFLDLNDRIGGVSRDFVRTGNRTVADAAALERAYKSGRIVSGGGGLAQTAIIDRRNYVDNAVAGDIHNKIHSFSMRERLLKANGHFDNHVILTASATGSLTMSLTITQMDDWLMAAQADTTPGRTKAQKIAANRPATLKDACWTGAGTKNEETQTASGSSTCNTAYPAGTTPRMAAGGPLSDDVIKCQLKAPAAADYTPSFNATQWSRLLAMFPGGVCDWSKPGVGQQALAGTWQSFGPAPANLLFDITRP
ncbi:MAG: DUF6351 family protein [Pseudomonadota bacterium]